MSLSHLVRPLTRTFYHQKRPTSQISLAKRSFSQMNVALATHAYVNPSGVYTVEIRVHPFNPEQVQIKASKNFIKIELLTIHGSGPRSMFRRLTKFVDIPPGFNHKMIKTEYKNGYLMLTAYKG